jgi:hypothetical protein
MCQKLLGGAPSDFASLLSINAGLDDDWALGTVAYSRLPAGWPRGHTAEVATAGPIVDSSHNFCKQHMLNPIAIFRSGFGLHTMACFPELQGQVGKSTLF